jgi:hypothetical protein
MPSIGQPYNLPDVHAPRKDVTCPAMASAAPDAATGATH